MLYSPFPPPHTNDLYRPMVVTTVVVKKMAGPSCHKGVRDLLTVTICGANCDSVLITVFVTFCAISSVMLEIFRMVLSMVAFACCICSLASAVLCDSAGCSKATKIAPPMIRYRVKMKAKIVACQYMFHVMQLQRLGHAITPV